MQSRALFGLCMAVGLIAAVWNVTTAAGQNCSDSFAEPPLGPERPEDLIAFRDVVKGEGDLLQDVVLLWTNVADNARCITVEASFSTTGAAEARDDWVALESIHDPTANRFPHSVGSDPGEVCYRVFASNAFGRSNYSNRVCLLLEALPPPEIELDSGGLADGGKGSSLLYPLAIGLPLAAAAVVTGMVVWSRTRRSPTERSGE